MNKLRFTSSLKHMLETFTSFVGSNYILHTCSLIYYISGHLCSTGKSLSQALIFASTKGPFKYYVIKKVGGWARPNTYVCLHGGWVGLARCLSNQKKLEKKGKLKKTVENIAIKYSRNKKL